MPAVELARSAVADLESLIRTHSLPDDTRVRVRTRLAVLGQFPQIGPALTGRWEGFRFILGPWRWMVLVYIYMEEEDRVVVVTIEDGRRSGAAAGSR